MINKTHFGKRIALLRKKIGLSQADLADKLGVTSQAVSKWECGSALPDLDLLLELSNQYNISINELLEDANLLEKLANRPFETDGIAYFVPKIERDYNVDWAKKIVSEKWVSRNWNEQKTNQNEIYNGVAKRIIDHGGLILETGAGPGGGFMPTILKNNPDASIIINDLSPTVVREWKRFLDHELDSPNIFYAAFDFCDIPFCNNCIDVVSDGGGIGNAEGSSKGKALKEICRVLKPGGLLVTSTGFVNKETLAALPEHTQKELTQKRPDVFEDLYEMTVLAGFKKIDSVIVSGWDTDNDDSAIATLSKSMGVNLRFTGYIRYCLK